MIEVLALDIDGVFTDNKVTVDENNKESKTISYRDVDAVFEAHRQGLVLVFITGEDSPWVQMLSTKLAIKHVYAGFKDKLAGLKRAGAELGVELDKFCYVGDSARDIPAILAAGIGYAPADAVPGAREAADVVLQSSGGNGVVAEVVDLVLKSRANS
ncbi:MAG TPA: HAD hydrolase family protein [Pyrinomonadaceae bacterium]